MSSEILIAAVLGALPVGLFTFVVMQWSVASGRLPPLTDEGDPGDQHRKSLKAARAARKQSRESSAIGQLARNPKSALSARLAGDLFHERLMFFGGGYYGTMAVLTYLLIESIEIFGFLLSLADPQTWIDRLGLQLLIDFLVNTITNIVDAFVWFNTLDRYLPIDNGLIWLAASYLGYLGGLHLTRLAGDRIWGWLSEQGRQRRTRR